MAAARNLVHVTLLNRQRARKLDVRGLRKITLALLGELKVVQAELGVTFVADEEMTLVNETFLQHEGSTDVITFDHTPEQDSRRKVVRDALHGELFICVDEANRQAKRFRATWQSELTRYIVHGVLHLLGHDDHRAADRLMMKREENRLVRKLASMKP
jgi:probable rRNA maturation factor